MPSSGESRELRCLTAISECRLYFFDKVVSHAELHFEPSNPTRHFDDLIPVLRGDNAYHLAEFFYLAEELELLDPENLKMLLERHNADMRKLKGDKRKMRLMGLNAQRVENAIFTTEQVKKISIDNGLDSRGKVNLDQTDLSKLVANLMSAESCRQTVVAFSEAELLDRKGHGKVLVSSPGTLERYFREHLAKIDNALKT